MFIRAIKKQRSKDSKIFYQYTLAQPIKVDGKVKQRGILCLGSNPLLANKINRAIVLEMLKAKIFAMDSIFPINPTKELEELADFFYEKYCLKYGCIPVKDAVSIPPAPALAEYHNIDIKGLEIKDVKTFGSEHLCKQVLEKLQLKECFISLGISQKQTQH